MTSEHEETRQTEGEARTVPIVEEDFATLLGKFKIKDDLAANIAENISHTGGANVFEEPELLTKRLVAWSGEIAPAKRKLVIEQWFAEKGIEVSPALIKKAGMSTDHAKEVEDGEKDGDVVRYVYDADKKQVRMVKQNEPGGTLDQARQLKEMAEEFDAGGKEPPFIPDEAGNLQLNPNARLTGMDLMAYDMIRKAQERGEPIDPLEAMAQAKEKLKGYQEILGGGSGNTPSWMADPAAFIKVVQDIAGPREGGGKASWMTDPAEFIKVVREISGEGKGDDKATAAIAELRQTIADMREDAQKQEIARLNDKIDAQQQAQLKLIQEIAQKIEEKGRTGSGRTEMDILHAVATEGFAIIRTEAAGMRGVIKELVAGSGLPPSKTAEESEARKDSFRKSLQGDREIEDLGQRLFFNQS